MARPAEQLRNRAQQRWPGATVSRRGRRFIEHEHPTEPGRKMLDVSIGPLHIEGTGTEIDTAVVPSTGTWQYEMVMADYHVHFRDTFNAGNIIEYRDPSSQEWVIFDPQSLNWIDQDNSRQQIAIKQAVAGVVEDDVLRFPAGWGAGRHFQYQCQTGRLQKVITIDAPGNLPAPTVAGPDIWLETEFSLSTSSGVDIYLDGVRWTKANNVRVKTANRIEFRDAATGTQVFWWLDFPRAWDSDPGSDAHEIFGQFEVRRQGGPTSLFITVRIPKAWVDAATFPIHLDPTIDAQVGASGDDGYRRGGSVFDNTSTAMNVGERSNVNFSPSSAFARFTGISGLSGATIDVSHMTLVGHSNTTGTPHNNNIYAEDAAAPSAPTSLADYDGRTTTTASVAWNPTGVTASAEFQSPSLNAVIQELADSYDPSVIQILYKHESGESNSNDFNQWRTYDNDPAVAAKLHIEYTAGGGGGDLSVSESESATVAESVAALLQSFIDADDAISVAEAVSMTLVHLASASDNVTVSEAVAILLERAVNVSDNVALSESVSMALDNLEASAADNASVTEAVTVLLISLLSVSDGAAVGEAVTAALLSFVNVSDAVGVTEAASVLLENLIAVTDSVNISESVSVAIESLLAALEVSRTKNDLDGWRQGVKIIG